MITLKIYEFILIALVFMVVGMLIGTFVVIRIGSIIGNKMIDKIDASEDELKQVTIDAVNEFNDESSIIKFHLKDDDGSFMN